MGSGSQIHILLQIALALSTLSSLYILPLRDAISIVDIDLWREFVQLIFFFAHFYRSNMIIFGCLQLNLLGNELGQLGNSQDITLGSAFDFGKPSCLSLGIMQFVVSRFYYT